MHNDGSIRGADDANLVKVPRWIRSNHHGERFVERFDSDGVRERVEDGFLADAMPAGALGDEGLIH